MTNKKLKTLEEEFLFPYPGGFNNLDMQTIGKRHKMSKMITMTLELLAPEKFEDSEELHQSIIKVINSSYMV